MCSGDDHSCPQFELHRKKLLDDLDGERRSFLKSASLMSIGVDFGVTQVVDGNWGIHAIIKKSLFAGTVTA